MEKAKLKTQKNKTNIGPITKALGGVAIIIFILLNNGLYAPTSARAIGYDAFTLVVVFFGGWLIYSAFKQRKK